MCSLSDAIYNDPSTMERICKIVDGLWNGTVKIINNPNDGLIACEIGDYWFYFTERDEAVTPDKFKLIYDVFTIANMILEAIIELDDDEYEYYCDILEF